MLVVLEGFPSRLSFSNGEFLSQRTGYKSGSKAGSPEPRWVQRKRLDVLGTQRKIYQGLGNPVESQGSNLASCGVDRYAFVALVRTQEARLRTGSGVADGH